MMLRRPGVRALLLVLAAFLFVISGLLELGHLGGDTTTSHALRAFGLAALALALLL